MKSSPEALDEDAPERVELRKEAYTMALYVAICLQAALFAVPKSLAGDQSDVLKIVWGTSVGLALAHWFAFRVSARLVTSGAIRRHDAEAAGAQVTAATAVAVLASVPVLLIPTTTGLDIARIVLAGFVGLAGYGVGRNAGASRGRSLVYAACIVVVAALIALAKNLLISH